MWSRACQSGPVFASMSAWTQTWTVPHCYAMRRTQESGMKCVKRVPWRCAMIGFPQERLHAGKANHPGTVEPDTVIRHLLWRQLLLRWYLWQQRVRVRVMIGFLVQGRVRIKIMIRVMVMVMVMVGVTFNVRVYHWSNCRRSKCRTFSGTAQHGSLQEGLNTVIEFDCWCCCIYFQCGSGTCMEIKSKP